VGNLSEEWELFKWNVMIDSSVILGW